MGAGKEDRAVIKTIFLDLDDTILDFSMAEAAALRRALLEAGIPPEDRILERYHHINAAQWALLEEGKLTREQVLERRFELLFSEMGLGDGCLEVGERYEAYLGQGHWFVPGAEALLETLSPRYALYLASNGTAAIQHTRLESAGIARYFRGIFISQEIGANKPDKAFFDVCFASVPEFSRDTALIVGDSLTSDIRGGRNAGIRTCWFNPKGQPCREDIRPDAEIRALPELPDLLERM